METDSRLVQCGSEQMSLFSVAAQRAGMNSLLCCSFYELVLFFSWNNAKGLVDFSEPTQSIGLLSYTFLVESGKKDVVVPVVCCTKCSLFFGARQREYHFDLSLMIFPSFLRWIISAIYSQDRLSDLSDMVRIIFLQIYLCCWNGPLLQLKKSWCIMYVRHAPPFLV
jgi:hypothetical protein